MTWPLLLTVAGFVALFLGGEALVRGSVALARRLGVSEIAVGVVLVGFGTSAPELLVSFESALKGHAELALGNVIGSNIANILLIVGAAALIAPIQLAPRAGRREAFIVLAATACVAAMVLMGDLGVAHGVAMLVALAAYLALTWWRGGSDLPPDGEDGEDGGGRLSIRRAAVLTLAGLALLVLGADLLVVGAVEIARGLGVSEAVIGMTVVAIGSSLPELAASAVAALRGRGAVAIGNVLGSNLFNLLGALGIVAVMVPVRTAAMDIDLAMLAMLALTGCFVALVLARRIGRAVGAAFLLAYGGFIWAEFAFHLPA